jgi:hypothetical protein
MNYYYDNLLYAGPFGNPTDPLTGEIVIEATLDITADYT